MFSTSWGSSSGGNAGLGAPSWSLWTWGRPRTPEAAVNLSNQSNRSKAWQDRQGITKSGVVASARRNGDVPGCRPRVRCAGARRGARQLHGRLGVHPRCHTCPSAPHANTARCRYPQPQRRLRFSLLCSCMRKDTKRLPQVNIDIIDTSPTYL